MPLAGVVGHARIVSLLSRAVARDTLPPSLLLAGPAGVGKRRVADALAAALNCPGPVRTPALEHDACGRCPSCTRIARGVHPDVVVLAPGESGTIRIEGVRDVVDKAGFRPFEGRRRVVIVDDAHALVEPAQHALLKTLEEPPSASVFLLVTDAPDALLATVRSRCPRLRFGPLAEADIVRVLTRDHGHADADARALAGHSDGSVGRALAADSSDVEEARAAATRLLQEAARSKDPSRLVEAVKDLTSSTKGTSAGEREKLAACLKVTASLLRDLGARADGGDGVALAHPDLVPFLDGLSRSYPGDRVVRAYAAVARALEALDGNASPRIVTGWLALQL